MELFTSALSNPYGMIISIIGFLGSLFFMKRAQKKEAEERYNKDLEKNSSTAADISVRISNGADDNDAYLAAQDEIDNAILNSIKIPKE